MSRSVMKTYYQSSPAFYPVVHQDKQQSTTVINHQTESRQIPFNQYSTRRIVNQSIKPNPVSELDPALKRIPLRTVVPVTKKVHFSYINPSTHQIEKHFIETIILEPEKPITNEWEQRYFELFQQVSKLLLNNEKITNQFLKMKDEIKVFHDSTIINQINQIQNYKSQVQPVNSVPESEYNSLMDKYEMLKVRMGELEDEVKMFKEKNIRLENTASKLQEDFLAEKNLNYKNQLDKNDAILKQTRLEYEIKEIKNEKGKLESEVYELKMVLAKKNIEIENIMVKKSQENQGKFEEKLAKLRGEYEKKEKKFEKMLEGKQKEIGDVRRLLMEVEEKERVARDLKDKYEKMYSEKKDEVLSLKKIQDSVLSSNAEERQNVLYEQRINQLNKIGREQAERINELEKINKQIGKKIEQYEDNYVCQEKLNYLHDVIETNKNQLLEEGGINYDEFNNKASKYFNGKIFERKMIYELKKDNQKLVEFLHKVNFRELIPNQAVYSQNIPSQDSGNTIAMEMLNMISDILAKMDKLTEGIKNGSFDEESGEVFSRDRKKDETKRSSRRQYKENMSRVSNELEVSKVYLHDLSETCRKLIQKLMKESEERALEEQKKKEVLRSEIKISSMAPKDQQMVQFYKQKNQQLENRVSELLNLSNMLKQKLCEKHVEQSTGEEYWKNQAKMAQNQTSELSSRYQKLLTNFQQSEVKKEDYQSKCGLYAMELQRLNLMLSIKDTTIEQLKPKIIQLESLQTQKVKLQRQISILNYKCDELKSRMQENSALIISKDREIQDLASKYDEALKTKLILEQENREKKKIIDKLNSKINFNENQLSDIKRKYENETKNTQSLLIQLSNLQTEKKKIEKPGQMIDPFLIEKLRSMILETEAIQKEITIENSNRNKQLAAIMASNYNFILSIISEIKPFASFDNSDYSLKIKSLEEKITQIKQTNAYKLEVLRSLLLQSQCLLQELNIADHRDKQTRKTIEMHINMGLQQVENFDLF